MLWIVWIGSLVVFELGERRELIVGQPYVDEELQFAIPIVGTGWAVIEGGRFADTDAVVELSGPAQTRLYVYDYDAETADSVIDYRLTEYEDDPTFRLRECEDRRRIASDGRTVIATLICEGNLLGTPAVLGVSVLEGEDRVLELTGDAAAAKSSYPRLRDVIVRMMKGFDRP
ncbi:MAG: hypothetical protein AAFX41_10255 [Bacteroidota bacterium]